MGTVNKFGATAKLLDTANAQYRGQERVNAEIFTAMEILGRKLERSEAERDRLARRLAQIESAATLDEVTGKFYLPAVIDPTQLPATPAAASAPAPRWMLASTAFSTLMAFVALGIALFSNSGPQLTKEQIAMLDALKGPQLAMVSPSAASWKQPEATKAQEPSTETAEAAPVQSMSAAETAETVPATADNTVAANDVTPPQIAQQLEQPAAVAPVRAAEDTIKPDPALPKSLASLEKRALDGVPEAQHDLATLYAAGSRVPRDYTRAIYWFKKAAGRGIANASYNLGVMYQQGLGVPADMKVAINWYEKAADTGHPEAMYNLGIAYIQGVGAKTDIDKGVAYFKRAANAGVAQAAYNLGVLYESNFIGEINTGKALEWYQVAAREGHAEAKGAVDRLTAVANARELNGIEPASGDNE